MSSRPFSPPTDDAAGLIRPIDGDSPAEIATAMPGEPAVQSPLLQRHFEWLEKLTLHLRNLTSPEAEIHPCDCRAMLIILGRWQRLDCSHLPRPAKPNEEDYSSKCLCAADPLLAAERLLQRRSGEILESAMSDRSTASFSASWLQRAELLRQSWDDDLASCNINGDSISRTELAERLIWELDDAELLLVAACRHTASETQCGQWMRQVMQCEHWLANHAEDFLAAGELARNLLPLFRRDLPVIDLLLAKTTTKLLQILAAAETAELSESADSLPPLDFHFPANHRTIPYLR